MASSVPGIHVVAFDVPLPADYGGVIDVYYKLKALSEMGVPIFLHCFTYGRSEQPALADLCERVFYYRRNLNKRHLLSQRPFIVATRDSKDLVDNLCQNNWPIFFEGLHTCSVLSEQRLAERHKVVRMHNIEHVYYAALAQQERNPFKKWYLRSEAVKLQRFERVLSHAQCIWAISQSERKQLASRFAQTRYLPAFHANEAPQRMANRQPYAFYHGNLAVAENAEAVYFLIQQVFNNLGYELRIAGSHPPRDLVREIGKYPNCRLFTGLSPDQIADMVREAQLNVLPTFQHTGVKLKLLFSLFNGGHVLVNSPMVRGTGLSDAVTLADGADDFRSEVQRLMKAEVDPNQLQARDEILARDFNNRKNAQLIVDEMTRALAR